MVKLKIEFSGGMELLFGNQKSCEADVPAGDSEGLSMGALLVWLRENLLTDRPELFMKDDSVRPGVLVLINDTDWEITGQLESELEENDTVVFISTLHGG